MMRVRSGSNSPVGRGLPGRLTAASEPGIRGQGYNPGWWQQLGTGRAGSRRQIREIFQSKQSLQSHHLKWLHWGGNRFLKEDNGFRSERFKCKGLVGHLRANILKGTDCTLGERLELLFKSQSGGDD